MSISHRKVYTKSLHLTEMSIRNLYSYPKSIYQKSISTQKVYTKCLYLARKYIRKVYIYPKGLYENSIRKVYI